MNKLLSLTIPFISILSFGQIGTGNSNPRGALDINKDDRTNTMGLVLPTNANVGNIINPLGGNVAAGTIIYDSTNDCVRLFKGDNTWSSCLSDKSCDDGGGIDELKCAEATNNGTLTQNSVASGVSSDIPYTGGNGSSYGPLSVNSTGVSGLTAALAAGNFNNGNGTLTFTISGTPTSSGTASFAITVGGQTCTFTRSVAADTPPDPDQSLTCSGWTFNGFGNLNGSVNGTSVSATATLVEGTISSGVGMSGYACMPGPSLDLYQAYIFTMPEVSSRSTLKIKFNKNVSNVKINTIAFVSPQYFSITTKKNGIVVNSTLTVVGPCTSVATASGKIVAMNSTGARRSAVNVGGEWFDEIEISGGRSAPSGTGGSSIHLGICAGAIQP
jgi:hypothetical protein